MTPRFGGPDKPRKSFNIDEYAVRHHTGVGRELVPYMYK
jgi:hypothetical protein